MTIHFKPNFFTRVLALAIIILLIGNYSNEQESHRFIVWLIGNGLSSVILQVTLFCLAFILACVTIRFGLEEE